MSATDSRSSIDLAATIVKTLVECGVSAKDLPDAMLGVWKIAEAAQVSVDDAAHIAGKALTETHGPHYTLSYIESTIQRLSNRGLIITPVDVLTGLLKLHAHGINGNEAETDLYAFLERLSPFVYSCSWFSYSTFPGWVTVAGILNNAAEVDRINAFGHSLARVVAVMRILP